MKQTGFIFKVLLISAGLSILIKYGGPILSIPATPTNALLLVLVPTLLWRSLSGYGHKTGGTNVAVAT
jgi:hypothetical protein